ncbi:flagellar filament capping protein FliD [Paenibacillus dakarensis]|uniref:flagellar filament capping protein FliD n=1 Tax=Paenibacillus dakarensis TaxID=1527293 RepID=UPI000A954950|nr:flagellar filament capping protein FliD [Paenibacillus dakarensis]
MQMRISGFSGMDIDSMVKQLITAKRAPLDKLTQQKTIIEWRRESYREMNSKMIDFKTKTSSFKYSSAMNSNKAMVSGNTTAIKAEATASASNISMGVEVFKLAQKSRIETTSPLTIKGNSDVPVSASLKTTLGELSKSDGSEEYTLSINGIKEPLVFKSTETIETVLNRINSSAKAKVKATFDEVSGKFVVSAKEYGNTNKLTGVEGSLISLFDLSDVQDAKPAEVLITSGGVKKIFTPDSNSFLINGVQLTFQEINKDKPATITTQTDPAKALETIKSFVESYNELIKTFSTKLGEEKYRSYAPLTDEQKKEMKENDIKLWEEKARSGLLKNDEVLRSTLSEMRSAIGEMVGDLSSIGITTGQYFENGKLNINEEKLKSALQSDPQKVSNIFQGAGDGGNHGIISSVQTAMNNALDKLVDKAGTSKFLADSNSTFKEESVIGRQLKDYNKRIGTMEARLQDLEIRYYKQFSAMERAMNQYNSQSSSLAGYFQ